MTKTNQNLTKVTNSTFSISVVWFDNFVCILLFDNIASQQGFKVIKHMACPKTFRVQSSKIIKLAFSNTTHEGIRIPNPLLKESSLDCSIWHSFCSFSYSRVYSDRIKLSSDVINCRIKKWERKSTLSTAFNADGSQDRLILCCCQWM